MKVKALLKLTSTILTAGLPGLAAAVTVTVDGNADVAGSSYQRLSGAVAYVNGQGAGPHVINVTTDSAPDNAQIDIQQSVTINGDADSNSIPCDILVDITTIQGAGNIGNATDKSYIEITGGAAVTINDLNIHPNASGGTGTGTTLVNGLGTYKPASGTSSYTLNRVKISGSDTSNTFLTVDAAGSDQYYATGAKRWYAYLSGGGVFYIANIGGAGAYDVALNDCHGGVARSHVLNIRNQSGTTTVNGGIYGHAGQDSIRVDAATGVTFTGSSSNRVRAIRSNRSSSGEGIRLVNTPTVSLMEWVDSHDHSGAASNTNSAFQFESGTVTLMRYCRGGNSIGAVLEITGAAVNATVQNCTFPL